MKKMNSKVKFVGTALGIFICYFYYGILQEKITKGKYEKEDGSFEPFTFTLSLVCFQCIVNYFYAIIVLKFFTPEPSTNHKEVKGDEVTPLMYAACALTYLLAMVTSNMSLQWVSYPTQVIGKSCKPIPVMLLGVLIGGKNYKLRKYLFILLIVVGVAMFIYKPGGGKGETNDIGYGEILLIMSLAMDGLTGGIQDRMRTKKVKPSSAMMMKMMNLFSIMYTLAAILLTGEVFKFYSFVERHSHVGISMVLFSLMSAAGQFFIFIMVSEFGPLPCSIVTTTRKFFTVLASVIIFGNALTGVQWLGTFVVFAGLFLDSYFK